MVEEDKAAASEADVLQWKYALKEQLVRKSMNDAQLQWHCMCRKGMDSFDCGIEHATLWWEVCELVTFVQPSSAAAEQVLSIQKNMWSDQQTSALSDMIRLSRFLRYNKKLEKYMNASKMQ
jgi:hypothetical protein